MISTYDYPSAKLAQAAGIDMILVGDSLGMVALGYNSTIDVTIDDMIHHGKAVRRGAKDTFMAVDMPFMTYHSSVEDTVKQGAYLFQKTQANALKLEGFNPIIEQAIKHMTAGGIPIIGHLGLTPQHINVLSGYKLQAKTKESIQDIIQNAKRLEQAGIACLVLECIPKEVGNFITNQLTIPTISIGAGPDCDGQVLVYHDILQYGQASFPKFVKNYVNLDHVIEEGLTQYIKEVKASHFPNNDQSYHIEDTRFLSDC